MTAFMEWLDVQDFEVFLGIALFFSAVIYGIFSYAVKRLDEIPG